jgi:hypothetical protein
VAAEGVLHAGEGIVAAFLLAIHPGIRYASGPADTVCSFLRTCSLCLLEKSDDHGSLEMVGLVALAEFAHLLLSWGAVRADRATCHGRADRFGKGFPESRRALSSRWFCVNVSPRLWFSIHVSSVSAGQRYFDFVSSGFVSGWS